MIAVNIGFKVMFPLFQAVEPEQLSAPNKTRARGPAGRRLPSFKNSKHKKIQNFGEPEKRDEGIDTPVKDKENNNVEENTETDVVMGCDESADDNVLAEEGSLTRRLWNSCQIL